MIKYNKVLEKRISNDAINYSPPIVMKKHGIIPALGRICEDKETLWLIRKMKFTI